MSLKTMYCHPVKSMAGIALDEAEVGSRGLAGDRRWMVVDDSGRFLTGRVLPELVRFQPQLQDAQLVLHHGGESMSVPPGERAVEVRVWRDGVQAMDCGDEAADWLSARLGRSVRLVHQADQQHRWLPDAKRVSLGDEVGFADAYPLLLIGSASVAALNDGIEPAIDIRALRPNLVIETEEAYCEDRWRTVQIGDLLIDLPSPCKRCVFTTVDPDTAQRRADDQPLVRLRETRTYPDGTLVFGMNAVARAAGTLRINDPVTILATHPEKPADDQSTDEQSSSSG